MMFCPFKSPRLSNASLPSRTNLTPLVCNAIKEGNDIDTTVKKKKEPEIVDYDAMKEEMVTKIYKEEKEKWDDVKMERFKIQCELENQKNIENILKIRFYRQFPRNTSKIKCLKAFRKNYPQNLIFHLVFNFC